MDAKEILVSLANRAYFSKCPELKDKTSRSTRNTMTHLMLCRGQEVSELCLFTKT